jgi:hypothetical protein
MASRFAVAIASWVSRYGASVVHDDPMRTGCVRESEALASRTRSVSSIRLQRPGGQVVRAGALVPQGAVDQHEAGRAIKRRDLAGRGDAHDQVRARCGQLFGDEHRERGADRHPDDSDLDPVEIDHPHLSVVAGPALVPSAPSGCGEVSDNVAVRIEQSHRRHRYIGQTPLAARLAEEVPGLEQRRCRVVLVRKQRIVHASIRSSGVTGLASGECPRRRKAQPEPSSSVARQRA